MDVRQPNKRYHANHSLVYSCQYHIIFCPKFRRPVLSEPIAERLHALTLEKQQAYGYTVLEMEVMPDHVHLLLDVNPQVGVNTVVGQIKGYTAHVLRQEFPHLTSRLPSLWTRSKFISSVGTVTLEVVKRYIEQQKGA
jgi:putative transposase